VVIFHQDGFSMVLLLYPFSLVGVKCVADRFAMAAVDMALQD